jgi:hypothetical protein
MTALREAPSPYKNWMDFLDNAPVGTVVQFGGESSTWVVIHPPANEPNGRNKRWAVGSTLSAGKYHEDSEYLNYYAKRKGLIILSEPVVQKVEVGKGRLTVEQLVALEEFINKQLEEAYERGRKDGERKSKDYDSGWSAGYDEGYNDGEYNCQVNHE